MEPGSPVIKNVGSGSEISVRDFSRREWARFGASGNLNIGALDYRGNEIMRFVPEIDQSYLV